MLVYLGHFLVGAIAAGTISLVFSRISGGQNRSMSFGFVIVAMACGAGALYLSPWVTPLIIVIYLGANFGEWWQDHH